MKKALKWTAIGLLGIVVILITAGVVVTSLGTAKANQTYEVTADLISSVPDDSISLAHGEHLAKIHGCASCHAEDYSGKTFIDAPPFLVVAPNLTPGQGGIGDTYSIEDWDRAIRYGVKKDGKSILFMPSKTLHNLSDQDTEALIAYLLTIPAIDQELPPTELRPLGKALAVAGEFDVASETHLVADREEAPPAGVNAAYGKYLSSITCTHCHLDNLEGGLVMDPQSPPTPSLLPAGQWNFEMFATAMRTGTTPAGKEMNPETMPWSAFKYMTDDELQAIHMYLNSL